MNEIISESFLNFEVDAIGKITILGIIGFVMALSIFLFQRYIGGIAEDAMLDATVQVVKDSPIDQ